MNTNGFVKLPRSILEWRWYRDVNTRAVFIHLLTTAAWENSECLGRKIGRGQCLTTVKELAAINQQTVQQTRTALSHLVSTNDITIESTPRFSIITLNNYELYQQVGKPANNPAANEPRSVPQPGSDDSNKPTIIKEKENVRSVEEEPRLRQLLDSAVSEYNSVCVSLERVIGEPSYQQAQLIRQAERELRGESFRDYFARVERSDFLTGRNGKFRASFEWLLRPVNIAKVLSGMYDGSYSAPAGKSQTEERDYDAPLW